MANLTLSLIVESLLVVLLVAAIYYCHRVYRGLTRIEALEAKKMALESTLNGQISQAQSMKLELGSLIEEAHAQSRARLVRVEDSPSLVPTSHRGVRETMQAAQSLRQRRMKREAVSHAA